MARVVALLAIGTFLFVVGASGVVTLLLNFGISQNPVVWGAYGLCTVLVSSLPRWVRLANRVADRVF